MDILSWIWWLGSTLFTGVLSLIWFLISGWVSSRPPQPRMLPARAYRDLGRQPKLLDLPVRRPPYVEAATTAAVFLFLAYLILGGA